ncbi:MAG TPA: VOC family protein [Candidatus Acidoferrales bacterium]|jgi:catechol 2,3-dioxygenase-like lactoylglutathione lyase family enzyme|nr:VOC family protein [Candidatus Acidoferrales bacterium]
MEQAVLSRIATVMLGVRDLKTSLDFYHGKLGLSIKMQEPQIALLDAGPITLGLSPGHVRLAPQVNGATEVVFQVENVRAARQALMDRGIAFMNEPRQVTPTDWAAHFRDPDGHLLSIFGPEGKI